MLYLPHPWLAPSYKALNLAEIDPNLLPTPSIGKYCWILLRNLENSVLRFERWSNYHAYFVLSHKYRRDYHIAFSGKYFPLRLFQPPSLTGLNSGLWRPSH